MLLVPREEDLDAPTICHSGECHVQLPVGENQDSKEAGNIRNVSDLEPKIYPQDIRLRIGASPGKPGSWYAVDTGHYKHSSGL
ncbi:hypothetical protein BDM02DRAFT_3117109 [Thelephora ganbajun]|uniref:Uncharacterized protein n=1 Tax=Thelephora ganbajun TaxID=370292 RepID=A0ACB6ZD14_THEGA|nr:hypothetical protein BDM02DRAFT_3117109 [Thelephora ganbajun]